MEKPTAAAMTDQEVADALDGRKKQPFRAPTELTAQELAGAFTAELNAGAWGAIESYWFRDVSVGDTGGDGALELQGVLEGVIERLKLRKGE